mmetsp:Transcript_35909/g.70574  ORF Transcript_35909/g.70574 Transcript_35909/m.70574 type:complete len:101 (-) Transcript_35909:120-422(-)
MTIYQKNIFFWSTVFLCRIDKLSSYSSQSQETENIQMIGKRQGKLQESEDKAVRSGASATGHDNKFDNNRCPARERSPVCSNSNSRRHGRLTAIAQRFSF